MSHQSRSEDRECPRCGERAEWLEEHADTIEYGCPNHHSWHVEKETMGSTAD